jgi:hypothetical protein
MKNLGGGEEIGNLLFIIQNILISLLSNLALQRLLGYHNIHEVLFAV